MRAVQRILRALWASVASLFMSSAVQDKTTKAQHVPPDTLHGEKLQGPFPEDNPYRNKPNETYRRMEWDQRHGWADYS